MLLGMQIIRDREKKIMKIQQSEYAEKILKRFNMHESKPQSTPMVKRQVKNRERKITEEIVEEYPCRTPYDRQSAIFG